MLCMFEILLFLEEKQIPASFQPLLHIFSGMTTTLPRGITEAGAFAHCNHDYSGGRS
jgi:hypothetical protein